MKVPTKKLLSKLEPEPIQEKRFVLKERRLFLAQMCAECETEAPGRTSGLKRKTEWVQRKPLNSCNEAQKKRKLAKIIKDLILAHEKSEKKLGLPNKPNWVKEEMILVDGAIRKKIFVETRNQTEKIPYTEISLKSTEKDEERKRVLHDWRRIKVEREREKQRERQKQREEARLALDEVKNNCGFQDNMDSMRDFEKIVGCSSTSYIFCWDLNRYNKL